MRHLFVATIAFACVSAPAFAHTRGHHQHHSSQSSHHGRHYASARHGGGAWCGAYMRQVFGIADPTLNLAATGRELAPMRAGRDSVPSSESFAAIRTAAGNTL
jgi:hypothetical protein